MKPGAQLPSPGNADNDDADLLEFAPEQEAYVHCGEPMSLGAPREKTITASMPIIDESITLFEVYLQTRVMHCRCGFQMEVPDSDAE